LEAVPYHTIHLCYNNKTLVIRRKQYQMKVHTRTSSVALDRVANIQQIWLLAQWLETYVWSSSGLVGI